MHFFKNSISFIAVMCVFGAGLAATSRVSVITGATSPRRLSSITNIIKSVTTRSTGTTTSSSSSVLDDVECIENYRECITSDTACGPEFEECTTNVLFHGHMGSCFGVLAQCSASGIESLFGTPYTSNLSTVDQYVDGTRKYNKNGELVNEGEVFRYTYPTNDSIMGIDIIGAATRNKLSTADCVKKYKKCLNKENVCGEDFELCTSDSEFKRQAVLCDSTLSRCQKEGFQQLFGAKVTTKPSNNKLVPMVDGDIRTWINDGATLAAANAVNTCYKVVDNCFLSACAKNPYRCVEGVSFDVINAADFVAEQIETSSPIRRASIAESTTSLETQSSGEVRKFFRAACEQTIGANKYCQITHLGRMPTNQELVGEDATDLQEEVFDDMYTTRNNRNILGTKITDIVEKFDTTAKDACIDTFMSCAVRSCGGGSGAACYTSVFGNDRGASGSINAGTPYQKIKLGCEAVINTDANCKYMAATQNATDNEYNYTYNDDGAFSTLFPNGNFSDMHGGHATTIVVDALNAELSTAYNAAAIEQMKKSCQNLVENCVKSMCGKDYMNCYRNRNDVSVSVYNSGNSGFDRSMNKVGGVLDYTIIQGLCSSTVRNADACAETLAIAKAHISDGSTDTVASWGTGNLTTVTNAWRNSASMATNDGLVNDVDANGRRICTCSDGVSTGICGNESGGNIDCNTPHRVSQSVLLENQAVATLFQDILALVESEAQAQYNAKLTREQHVCLAENNGSNAEQTYVWATLGNNTLPSNYKSQGLGNASTPSNDLYNSFCRVKISLMSDDKDLQKLLSGGSITVDGVKNYGIFGIDGFAKDEAKETYSGVVSDAYFATGDAFTCGSWISETVLESISKKIDHDARVDAGQGSKHDQNVKLWTTLGVSALGGIGSFIGMNELQKNGSSLGGLLNNNNTKLQRIQDYSESCQNKYNSTMNAYNDAAAAAVAAATKTDENAAKTAARTYYSKLDTLRTSANDFSNSVRSAKNAAHLYDSSYTTGSTKVFMDSDFDTMTTRAEKYSANTFRSEGKNALDELYADCQGVSNKVEQTDTNKSKLGANLIAAGVGTVTTALLTNGIVASSQQARYESAGNEAVKEWMDNLRSKIHCYAGKQYLGSFGDIISLDITE